MKKKKTIYVPLAVDILHSGHLNILNKAKKYGNIIVGLLSDKAIAEYKKLPLLKFSERFKIVRNLRDVKKIIKQDTWDYTSVLSSLKPNYLIHGDDWKTGIQKNTRLQVIKTLKKWNGKLVEPKYTKNISSSLIKKNILKVGTSPDMRKSKLKRLMGAKKIVRILESHSALTGLIIENLKVIKKQEFLEFDGMWSSSLTDSALRGKPDNQSVDYSTRILGLNEILEVTTKPIIFDADNGGRLEHLPYMIKSLERIGVSAAIIEDKVGLKKNSLFDNQSGAKQDTIDKFCLKISKAKETKISDDFLIIARIESFILGKSLNDALKRAEAYSRAGADAILIHSKKNSPKQIFAFAKKFIKSKYFKPMVAVPSSYSKTYEKDLIKHGFRIVIYANHMMRASYPAMTNVARSILINKRSFNSEKKISPIKEIINLIKQ